MRRLPFFPLLPLRPSAPFLRTLHPACRTLRLLPSLLLLLLPPLRLLLRPLSPDACAIAS